MFKKLIDKADLPIKRIGFLMLLIALLIQVRFVGYGILRSIASSIKRVTPGLKNHQSQKRVQAASWSKPRMLGSL
jgi:hypothetical protein